MGEKVEHRAVRVSNLRLLYCGHVDVVDGVQDLFFQRVLERNEFRKFPLIGVIATVRGGDLVTSEAGEYWWRRACGCGVGCAGHGCVDCGVYCESEMAVGSATKLGVDRRSVRADVVVETFYVLIGWDADDSGGGGLGETFDERINGCHVGFGWAVLVGRRVSLL